MNGLRIGDPPSQTLGKLPNSETILDLVLLEFPYINADVSISTSSTLSLHTSLFSLLSILLTPRMAATDDSPARSHSLSVAAALLLISSLILLSFVSVAIFGPDPDHAGYKQRDTVLGSRPPRCINKCNACNPCLPTLVAQRLHLVEKGLMSRDDDGYYLLAWKCRCGNKVFQP